ncbi:MAG: hypothetical protein LBH80_07030 [Prevotellaceae bacterium]|jgi:hypothetical protein|nr:hypothetical protein [Prevotellaceae bacterium]
MNEKKLQLVTFEQAKRLKELGFDWECEKYYNSHNELYAWNKNAGENPNSFPHYEGVADCFSSPAVALALKWMEEEKEIINETFTQTKHFGHEFCWRFREDYTTTTSEKGYRTRITAESALLDELLTILENENELTKEYEDNQN